MTDTYDGLQLMGDVTAPQYEPGPQCQTANKPHWNTGRCAGCDGDIRPRLYWNGWRLPPHQPAEPVHTGCSNANCDTAWPRPAYWPTICDECATRDPDAYDPDTNAPIWNGENNVTVEGY